MKRHHIFSILAASLAVTGAVATTALTPDGDTEKQRPSEQLLNQPAPQRAHYPILKAEGAADGVPYGLQLLGVSDKTVQLSWLSPEPVDGYFDDFEAHDDFAINSTGSIGWSYIDGDNANTYTWQACKFTNQGQKMAFIVMNPWMTSPNVNENPDYQPYSGHKMLVDFCAVDVANNDYIISPELSFADDFQVSFMARSYKLGTNYNAERVRVGYSTTGRRPSDFTWVSESPYVELPAEWTLIKYDIPQAAKYVAINCVSDDAFMLLIDDIFIGTNKVRPGSTATKASAVNPLLGFNVYRDGVKINTTPVDEVRYTDNVADYGTYSYTVTAVYKDGTESVQSEPLTVDVPDTRLLPFEDAFDDWTLSTDKWTTVSADTTQDNHWKVDYYTYGLVDPSATYGWSSLANYDQSLVSRELHTTDRAATRLRFELKLHCPSPTTTDYLSAELSCDGGQTWQEVVSINNNSGSFDWTTYEQSLAPYLTSDLFQVRFRAHGTNAMYINYWYLDDIKVWTPVYASATVDVTTAEGAVANCPVTLTGDNGAVICDTTDANGHISLAKIEEGKYTVAITLDGHNPYTGEWTVAKDATNALAIRLTQPKPVLTTTSVEADMEAEGKATRTFTLRNDGDGTLAWHLTDQLVKGSGDDTHRWQAQGSFNASGDLQQSIATDGEFYYTSSSVELGKFWKYSMDGKLLEQFTIPEMYYKLYDLTYDGRYFYGSDYNNRLFKLDFDNRRIAGIINIPALDGTKITHCSWDPDRKGFWVGSFRTIALVSPEGKLRTMLTNIDENNGVSVYGSAYDNVTPGGPYLWLADMTAANSNMIDKLQIRQYNLTTRKLTDETHVLTDAPGYVMGNSTSGENYVCGIFTSTDITQGKLTLIGALNQSPNLFFKYTLCEVNPWLTLSPKHGTLAAGAEQVITANFDALTAKLGDTFTTSSTLTANPEVGDQTVTFTLRATSASSTPRPQTLTATAGKASATLTWKAADGSTPKGYNVYRGGVKVNAQPIADTEYTDTKLVYGSYSYQVSAVYDAGESAKSDSVSVFVTDGAQYYAPLGLTASIKGNKDVSLTWQSPLAKAAERDTMSWATGKHEDQIGVSGGGYFYVASLFEPGDYNQYRNKRVESVSIQLVNYCTYLALQIAKDGTIIYRKPYTGKLVYDGTYTEIPVSDSLVLEPGHTYRFAFQVMNNDGSQPVSIDDGKGNGKGNLLSTDGQEWFAANQSGVEGNFNIRVNVAPTANMQEETPVGYNVYRDGTKVNEAPVASMTYDDAVSTSGTFTYQVSSVYADGGESALGDAASVVAYDISQHFAPRDLAAQVERNRSVSLRWGNATESEPTFNPQTSVRPATAVEGYPEFIRTFEGQLSEMGVATDGRFIYTSVYNEEGQINRYTLDGQYLGSKIVDGLDGVRNLAFDGEYLYAADNTNYIHRLDTTTWTIDESIAISEYSRHMAYVPELNGGQGGFEVGDWETSIYVAKNGSKLATGPTLKGAAGTACFDGKLYAFEQGNSANAYTIGVYDMSSKARIDSIDLGRYAEFEGIEELTAGGMSAFSSPEGVTYLLLALQNKGGNTLFGILDLGGLNTVAGYNVYRDGVKVNGQTLTHRYFEEDLNDEGTYQYAVQTVYIDGSTSDLSASVPVTIATKGTAKTPTNVKATQSSYGYNVILSYTDPDMNSGAASVESFEGMADGAVALSHDATSAVTGWTVSSAASLDGLKGIVASEETEAFGMVKVEGAKYLRLALRNADDHDGKAALTFYYSTGGTQRENFIRLATYTANEAWQDIVCELPDGTDYVALAKAEGAPTTYVDCMATYAAKPESNVYGYDIYRNGEKVNEEPVQTFCYTDHNLAQGSYDYQVCLVTMTAAESELSDVAHIDLSYDNGSLAPTNLKAEMLDGGNVKLNWQMPALGEPVYLKWHDGNCKDAAGLPNGGAFFAAANWFASDLKDYGHLALTDVEVYINEVPDALFVLVYENNTLVRQQFVPTLKQYSFNTIHLDEALPVNTSKNLRVAVYVEHNSATVPLGYDAGPAVSGRGDLYSSDGTSWSTIEDSGSDVDANWCISIGLSPYTAAKKAKAGKANTMQGYNVYRNGTLLNDSLLSDTAYTDTKAHTEKFLQYQVAAVYSATGEQFSEKVTLAVSGIAEATAHGLRIETADGKLRIYNVPQGKLLTVVATNGQTVYRATAADSYVQTIPMEGLATGVYVVKVGDVTFKVIR